MKIQSIILEADISEKIAKDPQRLKMLLLAARHDPTIPGNILAKMGPKPDPKTFAKIWSDAIEDRLSRTNYGDASRDLKYPEWLTKLYIAGHSHWEDIMGEAIDSVGAFNALDLRHLLRPGETDIMRYKDMQTLYRKMQSDYYRSKLNQIKNEEKIAAAKKSKREVILIDNDRYWVAVPFNYGACYLFNNTGHSSSFCTGSSSGMDWFRRYAPDGPIVMIVDKKNIETADGKWQLHAPTNQLVNSEQNRRYDLNWNDLQFAGLFPGLMKKIVDAFSHHREDISDAASEAGFDPSKYGEAAARIAEKFPQAYASREKSLTAQSAQSAA
jgi:hypothetical protein